MMYKNTSRAHAFCGLGFIMSVNGCALDLPGQSVGTFQVTGTLQQNTCGPAAVPALSTIDFPAEIRNRTGEAIWRRPQAPLASGTVDSKQNYHFDFSTSVLVTWGTPQAQCHMDQKEAISVHLEQVSMPDAGVTSDGGTISEQTLKGTHTIDLVPVSGFNCPGGLASEGGPFLAIPCRIEYDLVGTSRKPF